MGSNPPPAITDRRRQVEAATQMLFLNGGEASVSVVGVAVSTLIEIAAAPVPPGAFGIYGRITVGQSPKFANGFNVALCVGWTV